VHPEVEKSAGGSRRRAIASDFRVAAIPDIRHLNSALERAQAAAPGRSDHVDEAKFRSREATVVAYTKEINHGIENREKPRDVINVAN
jgi:hypothetical protein